MSQISIMSAENHENIPHSYYACFKEDSQITYIKL